MKLQGLILSTYSRGRSKLLIARLEVTSLWILRIASALCRWVRGARLSLAPFSQSVSSLARAAQ
jgi:hypothetical protein